jgi:exosortase
MLSPAQPHDISPPSESFPKSWRVVAGLLALSALVNLPMLNRLVSLWLTEEDMAHALFVPLVAGYAVWQSRDVLSRLAVGVFPAGLLICAFATVMNLAGSLAGEVLLTRLSWLLTVAGILYCFFGLAILRALAFPLLLLLFAIPIPQVLYTALTGWLQSIASILSERIFDFLDFTVVRQGNILELPGQKLSVAEACSGIRSVFSISFLVAVYLYFAEDRSFARWIVAVATLPTTVFINALRIVITGIVGQHDPVFALGLFHATAGWVLSLAGFIILLAIHAVALKFLRLPANPAAAPVMSRMKAT